MCVLNSFNAQGRGFGQHEAAFRLHNIQGADLVDLVAPDGHGFSLEQVRLPP